MNLYLLLEGRRGEAKIYPAWLESLERPYQRISRVDHVNPSETRSYYSFSAEGYPSIIGSHLINAVKDVCRIPGYHWLIVCLDVDESTVDARVAEVEDVARRAGLDSSAVRLFVCAQNRCIESWILGNMRLIGGAPPPYLAQLRDFYDVRQMCPEQMGHPRSWRNHAQFHYHYVRQAFKAKRMLYSKRNPGDVASKSYLRALQARVDSDPNALPTFRRFLRFVEN